jgi:hypothetical protein
VSTKRAFTLCAATISLILLGGCRRKGQVYLEHGSTAEQLAFNLSTWTDFLAVRQCSAELGASIPVAWEIMADSGWSSRHPRHIVYGHPPTGFRTITGPLVLQHRCYEVLIGASPGYARFRVEPDHSITLLPLDPFTQTRH